MFFEQIKTLRVADIAKKLKHKISRYHDEIPTKIFKESINSIIIPIIHIIIKSLLNGCVPLEMKIAKIIPVFYSFRSFSSSKLSPSKHITSLLKIL